MWVVGEMMGVVNVDMRVVEGVMMEIVVGKNVGRVEDIRCYVSRVEDREVVVDMVRVGVVEREIMDVRDRRC